MTAGPDTDRTGTVALVTGATGGIGKEIARGLARMGATVVIGARNLERGEAARAQIAGDAARDGAVAVMPLDVADLASIRAFAKAFRERFGTLGVLVNNAGAWFTDRRQSPDGIELTFATNVLGPHLLTESLLDLLRASGRARVVNVVSSIQGNYDATDLQFSRRKFDGYKAYSQSKQALSMLTWGFASRLTGSGVTANAASPGFVRTDFNQNAHGLRAAMIGVSVRLFGVSPAKGADTPLWVATARELDGVTGKHFEGRKEKEAKFREPGPIADLERRCEQMEAGRASTDAG
jgi:NAD(P)-dependent dehydrogenase (short-subunit alcohol dehydrogenase family)